MRRQARFRDVLAVREFRALWVAELLSVAGDQLARVALAVLVYQQTSSAGWTALAYALTYLPSLIGGALLSALADRHPRRDLMIVVDCCRALLAGAMALPFVPLPVLIGLVFALTLAGSPFKAAQQALLPTVLPGDAYVTGLALRTVTNQAAQLAGFVGGGALLTVLDPYVALGMNAGTFLVAALVLAAGVRHRPAARTASTPMAGTRGALRLIWRDRRLRGLIALSWLVGFFVVPEGLAAPYAAGLGAATVAVGLLLAADPVGSIVGAWLVAKVPQHRRPALITPLAVAAGVPLAVCLLQPGLVASVSLWAASGACSTAYVILAQASFTRRVPDHSRAAATGLASTGLLTSQGVAILGGGLLAEITSPALAIASAGVAGAILAGIVGTSWRGSRADRSGDDNTGDDTGDDTGDAMTAPDVTSPCPSSSAPPPVESAAEHGTGGAGGVIVTRGAKEDPPQVDERSSRVLWRWPLWYVPKRALFFILLTEAMAVGTTVVAGFRGTISRESLVTFGLIICFGLVVAEMTRHVERVRRRFNDTPHVNFTSVWVVPAALLLPPLLAAGVVVVLYLHLFWRSWYRVRGVHAYRLTFSATSMTLATYAASAITRQSMPTELTRWTEFGTVGAVVLALLAFSAVNSGLVGAAICLFDGRLDLRRAYGTARENALEYGTLGLGAVTAMLIVVHPAWPVVLVPALLVLHRSVLMRQLEQAAATDAKTGLTNAVAWTSIAARELERARGADSRVGVLMIDLDHFKTVNDTHGHVVGDQVLRAMAEALSKSVRRNDLVGRWGGEEFVVLCPEVATAELQQIGERVCELVRRLRVPVSIPGHEAVITGLTVSIGVATYPTFGPDLQDVLLAADDALFVAKDKGRDQVRAVTADWIGQPPPFRAV